jgi:hypothetical protein
MRVRWSRHSSEHLVAIREYIREHNLGAAERVRLRIIEVVDVQKMSAVGVGAVTVARDPTLCAITEVVT